MSGNNNAYTAGESVQVTFEIVNNGGKTLEEFCVTDTTPDAECLLQCTPPTAMLPGDSFSCDITYEVPGVACHKHGD